MHRRASNRKGAVIACVGHAVRQRTHEPQRLRSGASGSKAAVVMISARKNQLPSLRLTRLVCLPTNRGRRAERNHAQGSGGIDVPKGLCPWTANASTRWASTFNFSARTVW